MAQQIKFIEQYDVPGVGRFAIEDYEDGAPAAQHFFPHTKHKRYHLWRNGCGIGQADTLADAKLQIRKYVLNSLLRQRDDLSVKLSAVNYNLTKLAVGVDYAGLDKFKVENVA